MQIERIDEPLVSVIIITYNQENYIEQCIKSVLSQETKYPFEIVVSDDHSDDNTPIIIERIAKAHPGIIHFNSNVQNVGIVKNYLNALNQCQGKYLCLLGGDDYWIDVEKIQRQVDFLELHPDYGLVYSDLNILNEDLDRIEAWAFRKSGKLIIEGEAAHIMCKGDCQIMPQTVCLRLKLLNAEYKKIMDDPFFLAEDFPTWFWVSCHSKIHFMPMVTAIYRSHKKSFTNSQSKIKRWQFSRSHIYMRKKIMRHLHYMPANWNAINTSIQRGIMNLSLKTGMGKKYGIYSYSLISDKNMEDELSLLGIKYQPVSFLIRALIFLLKCTRIIKKNKKV